jgi:uncharacterized protein YbaR (Trm112 family)
LQYFGAAAGGATGTEIKCAAMASIGYEHLVCPVCKQPLVVTPDEDALKCAACKRLYPIRDGIPILLPEEAVVEPSA